MGSDCDEIGSGKCPCGQGLITVEKCTPDHGWGGRFWIVPHLACAECATTYTFDDDSEAPSLVLKSDVQAKAEATRSWHEARKSIETSEHFKQLRHQFENRLAAERSKAAEHRLLQRYRMAGMPIARYRRDGFKLSATNVHDALRLLGVEMPALLKAFQDMEQRWQAVPRAIASVKTGINGLRA